jgi:hypothetical protein
MTGMEASFFGLPPVLTDRGSSRVVMGDAWTLGLAVVARVYFGFTGSIGSVMWGLSFILRGEQRQDTIHDNTLLSFFNSEREQVLKRVKMLVVALILALSLFAVVPVHAMPLGLSCYGNGGPVNVGCDGHKPPPFSSCQNVSGIVATTTLYDSRGGTLGVANLWESNSTLGCASVWVDILNNGTHGTWEVQSLGNWEDNDDGSNYGALDSLPHNLSVGQREDTYMVGETGTRGNCFNGAIYYVDEYGVKSALTTVPAFHNQWCTG